MNGNEKGLVVNARGAVLPLVLGILLSITLLLTTLLQMPCGTRLVASRYLQKQQQVYDAESALLVYLDGLPEGYFEREPWRLRLPKVTRGRFGPWAALSADLPSQVPRMGEKQVMVLAGFACDSVCSQLKSYEHRRKIYEGFKRLLNSEITMAKPPFELKIKSGNRRFFGHLHPMSLWVQEGDLTLDLEGNTSSARFLVDGSVELRGNVLFDTLRVYARGPLTLRGKIRVRWLEAFSEQSVEISRGVEFSGVVLARQEVLFPNGPEKVRRRSPSFVMSLDGEIPMLDSMMVPDFIEGLLKPFQWSLL